MTPPELPFPGWVDFAEVKARVSVEDVLAARGVPLRRRGRLLVAPCPIHHGDNPTAFVVDPVKNLWHCFSQCGEGGDVIELVRRLDGVSAREAALRLTGLSPSPRRPAPARTRPFRPFERSLYLDADVPWLAAKGILPSTARMYEAGAWRGLGMLADCVAVRLHSADGAPLGYAGRRLTGGDAKWVFPAAFPKRDVLYGHHRVDPMAADLVVVECPWGVMRLAQIGVAAVALLGTAMSDRQAELLSRRSRVTLMLDGDPAGRKGATEAARRLEMTVNVRIVRLPTGKDPDDLTDAALADAAS